MTKKSLRQQMTSLLLAQSAQDRDRKSRIIKEKLWGDPGFLKAGAVCFYVALPMEVNTHPMIQESLKMGKKVLVPLVDVENKELKLKEIHDFGRDLTSGSMGILEPASEAKSANLREVQCIVTPALAFDLLGHRLGRGGGFYDRLLEQLPAHCVKIGLAFSFQVIPEVPLEIHDRKVDRVLTEN